MEAFADITVTAVINAPVHKINLTRWLFTLKDEEYQACSSGHITAGGSVSREGKWMSINVEQVADTLLVQHYVEDICNQDHCRVNSLSDSFSPAGRTKLNVTWELRVKKISDTACEFSNRVIVSPTADFLNLLEAVPIKDVAPVKNQMAQNVQAHNEEETPLFAKDIETKALDGIWD